jgi:hypothetical protein
LVKVCTIYKLNNGEIKEAILQYIQKNYGMSRDGNIEFADTIIDKLSGTAQPDCYLEGITITIENSLEKQKELFLASIPATAFRA